MHAQYNRHARLRASSSFLLMVDIQERLLPAIANRDAVLQNSVRLLTAARELNLPLIVTEQYPKGIGPTVPELAALIPEGAPVLSKASFSCCGAPSFDEALEDCLSQGRSTAVLFGVETHICVLATAMDLLERGVSVALAADACGSRSPDNHALGLEAARDCGALIIPTETVVYHILGEAGTPQFKALLPLFK